MSDTPYARTVEEAAELLRQDGVRSLDRMADALVSELADHEAKVREEERERCAQACDVIERAYREEAMTCGGDRLYHNRANGAGECAARIRALRAPASATGDGGKVCPQCGTAAFPACFTGNGCVRGGAHHPPPDAGGRRCPVAPVICEGPVVCTDCPAPRPGSET